MRTKALLTNILLLFGCYFCWASEDVDEETIHEKRAVHVDPAISEAGHRFAGHRFGRRPAPVTHRVNLPGYKPIEITEPIHRPKKPHHMPDHWPEAYGQDYGYYTYPSITWEHNDVKHSKPGYGPHANKDFTIDHHSHHEAHHSTPHSKSHHSVTHHGPHTSHSTHVETTHSSHSKHHTPTYEPSVPVYKQGHLKQEYHGPYTPGYYEHKTHHRGPITAIDHGFVGHPKHPVRHEPVHYKAAVPYEPHPPKHHTTYTEPHHKSPVHHKHPPHPTPYHPEPHHAIHSKGPTHAPSHEGYKAYEYSVKETPQCAYGAHLKHNLTFCLEDAYYPLETVIHELEQHGYLTERLLTDVPYQSANNLVDGLDKVQEETYNYEHYFGGHKHHYLPPYRDYVYERDYYENGGYICPADIFYSRPKRAMNAAGEWKVIVNLPAEYYAHGNDDLTQFTQTLRLEQCIYPDSPCSYVNSQYHSRCVQKHNFVRLMAWTYESGLHMDSFRLPVSCSCHVDGIDYFTKLVKHVGY